MAYREHFHEPGKLARLIQMRMNVNIHAIIKWLAHELIDDAHGDMHDLYDYFSEVYDGLYHELLFRRITLQEDTRELLEVLATPLFRKTAREQQSIIEKYIS